MKKLLTIVAMIGVVTIAYGQGIVTFNNTAATLISTNNAVGSFTAGGQPTVGPSGRTAAGAGLFNYALFVAPSTVSSVAGLNDANWTFTGAYAASTTATSGGRLFGGQPTLATGYLAGNTYSFVVRGWSSNVGGQDWNTVSAYLSPILAGGNALTDGQYFGASLVGQTVPGGGPIGIGSIFGASPNIGGFTLGLLPVPEPSTFALAGLGAAALLIFRRRK